MAKDGQELERNSAPNKESNDVQEQLDRSLSFAAEPYVNTLEGLQQIRQPMQDLQERMRVIADALGPNSKISRVAARIAEQHKAIQNLAHLSTEPPPILDLEPLANPVFETNERLRRIEARFEQMQAIANEAAAIATDLQAAATEFLDKFERAADNNDRAASRAIRIGAVAILVAVVMPLIQILYAEYWRVPQDAAAIQAAISDLKADIVGLKVEQSEVANRIVGPLENADRDSVEVLREIRDLLKSLQERSATDRNQSD